MATLSCSSMNKLPVSADQHMHLIDNARDPLACKGCAYRGIALSHGLHPPLQRHDAALDFHLEVIRFSLRMPHQCGPNLAANFLDVRPRLDLDEVGDDLHPDERSHAL